MEIFLIILAVLTAPIWLIFVLVGCALLFGLLEFIVGLFYVIVILLWALLISLIGVIISPIVALVNWLTGKKS